MGFLPNSANGGRVDLFCWNMTADTLIWQIPEIDPYGNSSVCKPLYHDGLVYFRGFQTLHAVNVETGEQVWMHEFPGDFDDALLGEHVDCRRKTDRQIQYLRRHTCF